MSVIDVSYQRGSGLPFERVARNGGLTSGMGMARLTDYINTLGGRRMHILAQGGDGLNTAAASTSQVRACARFQTSPNCAGVEALVVVGQSSSTTVLGGYTFSVNEVGSALVNQGTRYLGGNATGVVGPSDIVVDRLRFKIGGSDLIGDASFNMICTIASGMQLIYFVVYEVQQTTLDTTSGYVAPAPDVFGHGSPILDRDIGQTAAALWTNWKHRGTPQFVWTNTSNSALGGVTITGTTYTNILSASTAGYSANAAGFWTIPYRKSRMTGTTVPVIIWADVLASGNGQLRVSNSSGVIGTVSSMGIGTYSAIASLDATISTSDLVIVEARDSVNPPDVIVVRGCGMYEYQT
jgi:hypothetical protein